jgi:hypothetical protein
VSTIGVVRLHGEEVEKFVNVQVRPFARELGNSGLTGSRTRASLRRRGAMNTVSYRLLSVAVLVLACASIGADNCGFGNPFDKNAWSGITTSGAGANNGCGMPQGAGGADVGAGGADVGAGGAPEPSPQNVCGDGIIDPFAGIDPQTLAAESLKASALAYALSGLVNSSATDPNISGAALDALTMQDAPMAEMMVDAWLAGNPPGPPPRTPEEIEACVNDRKCPRVTTCVNAPYSTVPHGCGVVNCGSAACGGCPDWYPDPVKNPVYKSWCAYVCRDLRSPWPVVAVGVVFITAWNNKSPSSGSLCFPP